MHYLPDTPQRIFDTSRTSRHHAIRIRQMFRSTYSRHHICVLGISGGQPGVWMPETPPYNLEDFAPLATL